MRGITKLSERTVKCKKSCDERDFYWAEDDDSARKVLVRASADKGLAAHPDGGVVHHNTQCDDVQYVPVCFRENGGRPSTNGEPESNGNGHATDERLDALQALLGDLVGSTVDEDAVRSIVDERVDERADERLRKVAEAMDRKVQELQAPTTVVVNNAETGEERELPDVTHEAMPKVLKALDANVPVWMVGPAGTGKSTIARQCAEALDLPFGAISLSPNTPLSELMGYMDANGVYHPSELRRRFEDGGVFLFDEIDNGHPSTLAKVNMALANGHMAFPDGMVERHPDFRAVTAANTFGTGPDRQYVGRLKIDAATLDRFATVQVGVDESLEESLALAQGADPDAVETLLRLVRKCRKNADEHQMPLCFSPRASIHGAKLLAAGFSFEEVVDMRVRKGVSDGDWKKVSQG